MADLPAFTLHTLLDNLREGAVLIDHALSVVHANRAAERMLAMQGSGGAPGPIFDRVPGIERTETFQALLRCLRTNRAERVDHAGPVRDGRATVLDVRIESTPAGLLLLALDVTEARENLRAEAAERERFFTTLQSIGDGVIATDARGRVTLLNPVAEALTGYLDADARGRLVEEVFHIVNEETRAVVENPTARVLREHVVVGLANHTSLIARDGTERPIADSGAPIRDLSGAIVGTVLVFRDQSEERAAHEALRRSEMELRARLALEARFARVAQSVPGVICAFLRRHDGTYAMPVVSDAVEDVYGLRRDDLATSTELLFARMPPDDAAAVAASVERSREAMTRWHARYRYRHPTKGLRWLEGWSMPAAVDEGTVWHGFVMDVTERVEAEDRLARLSRMYRTVVDVQEVVLRGDDESALYRSVCQAAMRFNDFRLVWIGVHDPATNTLRPSAAAGPLASFLSQLPGSLDPSVDEGRTLGARAFLSGATLRCNDYLGDPRFAPWHDQARLGGIASGLGLPLFSDRKPVGVLVLYADVAGVFDDEMVALLESMAHDLSFALERLARASALRDREEQLRAAQKMEAVGRLAGGIAHDFNNLLCVIGSYTEFTLANATDEATTADLKEVLAAARRAESLTRQLLAFSRKQILRPEVIDLNARVADTERMLQRLIGEDIALTFAPSPEVWSVCVDPGQLEQVLMNLVVNARDAMPDGGALRLATRNETLRHVEGELLPGDYAVLSVRDNGTGMDESTLARIFEPFYTTKGPGKGTGLGLSTAYGIVVQSGGGIRVQSAPGQGSCFEVLLPRSMRRPAVTPHRFSVSPRAQGREVVLVVEDEEVVRSLARRILTAAGYTVITATNGVEALALCADDGVSIDLLLTDVVMPGMNGRELAARLAAARPGLRVLFMSGYTDDVIAHHGVLEPGVHLMSKPFNAALLTQRVRAALDA